MVKDYLGNLISSAWESIKNRFSPKQNQEQSFNQVQEPTPINIPTNIPTPTPTPTEEEYYNKFLEGYGNYNATPSAEAVKVMASAPSRYEIYEKYPYLLPALAIIETGAGQNITRPKNVENPQNLLNWSAYGNFVPQSQAESVEKALTGIGERMPYYEDFRNSQKLEDFVKSYAPASDGNTGYLDNLIEAMQYFDPNFTYDY